MSPKLRRFFSIGWRGILTLLGLAVVVVLSGDQYEYFDLSGKTLFWAAIVLAGATALDSFFGTLRRVREIGRDAAEARVQKALVGLLVEISDVSDVAIQELGASAFVPRIRVLRPSGWKGLKLWTWRIKRVLVRVMRFRLDESPQPTPVVWSKGKGAVGCCWAASRAIHRDWHEQATKHSSPSLSVDQFHAIDEVKRDGFEHGEFVAIAQKYSEVLAAPVLSVGGAIVGVISIDVAFRAGIEENILMSPDTAAQADMAAALLLDDLKQLYPQA